MKKETAVEWLEQEFIKLEQTTGVFGVMYELIEQAKEMEKKQHKKTATRFSPTSLKKSDFDQYYNETYGK
jgi:hypothetical protein